MLKYNNMLGKLKSPEFFKKIIDSIDDLISIHDMNYRILWANSAFCEYTGIPFEELKGKFCYEVLKCDYSGSKNCSHYRAMMGEKTTDVEHDLIKKGKHFLVTALPLFEKDKMIASIHIAKDINEIKELKKQLESKELFYTTIVENIQDIITILSPEGKIIYESPSVKNVFGYEEQELIGMDAFTLIHPEDVSSVMKVVEEGIKIPGYTAMVTYRARHKDGRYLYFQTHGINLINIPEIKGVLLITRDITDRVELENKIQELNTFNEDILNNLPVGIVCFDDNYRLIYENPAAKRFFGVPEKETSILMNKEIRSFPEEQKKVVLPIYEEIRKGESIEEEVEYVSVYGRRSVMQVKGIPLLRNNKYSGALLILNDITEQKKREEENRLIQEELFQMQKIESVGKLAGGIAHDFNNILTVIGGNLDYLMTKLSRSETDIVESINEMRMAAERAALLTSQLLAFSRKQVYRPRVINLNKIIKDLERMLLRLIGEHIALKLDLSPNLKMIKADPSQMDQVIINIITNARDAMPQGGQIVIKTANKKLTDEDKKIYPFVVTGEYVSLSIQDTGVGMSEEVRARVFEPFFTTKEIGKGTGLGLSVVYGIVKQNKGFLFIDSEVGKGTTVRIYIPPTVEKEEETTIIYPEDTQLTGKATILVVEDDRHVRSLIVKSLREHGFTVLEAKNGLEALHISEEYKCKIDLILTDVIMPEMSGAALVNELTKRGLVKKVLYMSGYTENIIAKFGVVNKGIELIEKPFKPDELIKKIISLLK